MTRGPNNDRNDEMNDPFMENGNAPQQAGDESTATRPQAVTESADYQALKAERDALFERLARASAEFKNSQRRLEQDLEARTQFANTSLIKTLLPVIDNFERALAVDLSKFDTASVLKGLQIVHDQLMSVLKQQNVEEIAPPAGTAFDPSRHEALIQQESTYKSPTVVQLLQKGYSLHNRTLRPAQVAVSKSLG